MTKGEVDYFKKYMENAEGTPELIIKGVLLFFQSAFSEEQISDLMYAISNQDVYTLDHTEKLLKSKYHIDEEIIRQIQQLMQRKFKEAIDAKENTQAKMDFIRSIKKKH